MKAFMNCDALVLDNIPALLIDVKVDPSMDGGVLFEYEDEDEEEKIKFSTEGNCLLAESSEPIMAGNNSVSFSNFSGGSISINGSVFINGKLISGEQKVNSVSMMKRVQVTIPENFPLKVKSALESKYVISNESHGGQMEVSLSGETTLYTDEALGLNAKLSGAAAMKVGSVKDRLNLVASGSSQASLEKINVEMASIVQSGASYGIIGTGDINGLGITTSGSAALKIDADINHADINASGASSVKLGNVVTSHQNQSGAARIHITNHQNTPNSPFMKF